MNENDPQAVRRETLAGLKWSFASQALSVLVTLVVTVILARLLTPGEFGLVGMVTVLSGFGYALRDLGLGSAIVQAREVTDEELSSVFWTTLLVGLALGVLLACLAGPIARFYDMPALRPICVWLSLDYLLTSFNTVHDALLRRRMEFRRLLVIDGISNGIAGAGAVVAALAGLGAWALVIRLLLASATRSPFLWFAVRWRPAFTYQARSLSRLLAFSMPLLGTVSLDYWTQNLDKLLIGRYLGDVALGIYGRAYAIMLYPLQNLSQVVSKVMFPAYSRMEDDTAKVKRTYLRVARTVAVVTFPLMFGVAAACEPFVLTVLGHQWTGLIPVLRVLAILGAFQSIQAMNGDIFLSQGATPTLLRVGGAARLVLIAFIVAGLNWGILGVAASYTAGSLLLMFPVMRSVGRLIDLSLSEWLISLSGVFAAAVIMACVVVGLDRLCEGAGYTAFQRLAVAAMAGSLVYLGTLATVDREAVRDAIGALQGSQA